MFLWAHYLGLVVTAYGLPKDFMKEFAENSRFDDFENFIPPYDITNFDYPLNALDDNTITNNGNKSVVKDTDVKTRKSELNVNEKVENITKEFSILDILDFATTENLTSTMLTSVLSETTTPPILNITEAPVYSNKSERVVEDVSSIKNLTVDLPLFNDTNRLPRQESNDTDLEDDPEFKSEEKESQENSSEEDMNMVTGLLSAFLGGFSKDVFRHRSSFEQESWVSKKRDRNEGSMPDGGIDLDAIIGLLGSLSTQNPDGSYDFQGLTDLLRGFFGGEGGSDIGAFAGSLLGAVIKGIANPPGSKGAGKLTGKIVVGILPALSGPPDADDDMGSGGMKKQKGLDSGGFLAGLLKTVLGSSGGPGGLKVNLLQTIFTSIKSFVTNIISSSSSQKKPIMMQ